MSGHNQEVNFYYFNTQLAIDRQLKSHSAFYLYLPPMNPTNMLLWFVHAPLQPKPLSHVRIQNNNQTSLVDVDTHFLPAYFIYFVGPSVCI